MKGQLKIQEMAFVLIAVVIFFALVFLFYLSVRSAALQKDANALLEDNARALISSISRYPELGWGDCDNCIDLDKAVAFKETGNTSRYSSKWEVDYLMIDRLYPKKQVGECTFGNYPSCSRITMINSQNNTGAIFGAFVNLCRWESSQEISICELGRIYASGRSVNSGGFGI